MIFQQSFKEDIHYKRFHYGNLNIHLDMLPRWDHFIPWFDNLWNDPPDKVNNGEDQYEKNEWIKLYNETNRGFFVAPDNDHLDHFPVIQYINSQAKKHLGLKISSWHLYGGFQSAVAIDKHTDTVDVMVIQAIGVCPWKVFAKDKEKSSWSGALMPGNYLWLPKGLPHAAYPNQSRLGISLSFVKGK